jgi:Double zinc ribbon
MTTTAQYIEEILKEEGISLDNIPITKFVVWFAGSSGAAAISVNQTLPQNDKLVVVAIFRGLGEWRVYCMPREESKDPKVSDSPVRIVLTQIAPTSDGSAVPPALFREMLKAEFRALVVASDDEDVEEDDLECIACGAEMPYTFDFCGECGARLPAEKTVKCGDCGEESPETASFCSDCGKALPEEKDEEEDAEEKPAVPQ